MNEKTLKTLEFNKIIDMLASRCVSAMGKEAAYALTPVSDVSEITGRQQETNEASGIIRKKGAPPLGGIRDIRASLKRASMGGVLSVEELSGILDFLYVLREMASYGKTETKNDAFPLLGSLFARLAVTDELEAEINRCILPPNELNDNASAELSSLRRQMRVAGDRVREHLNKIIHSGSDMLQDAVITIRGGRYCVPVKQEFRHKFNGMVHDQSSTGQTVFMEPMSVVNLNNAIKELQAQEKAEIERILRRLSGMVAEEASLLQEDLDIITHLDFVFAKGALSLAMNASEPVLSTEGRINIKRARHPLIPSETVVPVDIRLGDDFTTLLITGPNTGGKTVTLKTIGLFTLMGQAGLHIPAFDNSVLNVFDAVFADIGDEQSIEQSLSTFSSHMSNIVGILNDVTGNSLVLLDELGAGTDPTEGAALAVAILEHLSGLGVRAAVTTHYSELKVYALSTDGVENASCEFDVATLKPTYRLNIGIPGKSNAFEIAKRLGLSGDIIQSARNVLSMEDKRFEDIITDLEISRKTVILEQERAEGIRLEAEKLKKEFENLKDKLQAQREKLVMEARTEARQIYIKAEEEAAAIIREMHKNLNAQGGRKELDDARLKLKDKLTELGTSEPEFMRKPEHEPLAGPIQKGMRVFVGSLNKSGVVISPPDSGGDALVQMGVIKMKIKTTDLFIDTETNEIQKTLKPSVAGKSLSIRSEIDMRGMMTEEGLEKCGKYLDDAYMASLDKVTLIHGKGTGALRRAVHTYLKTNPFVKSFRLGTFGEGEDGVTIVELRKE